MKKQETVKIITGIVTVIKNGVVDVYSEKLREDIQFFVPINHKIQSAFIPKIRRGFIHFLHKINHPNTKGIITMNL